MSGRTETMNHLSCPHHGCDYYDEVWDDAASSVVGKLTLEVECRTCGGRDHLMYDIGDLDASEETPYEPGEDVELTENIPRFHRQSGGEIATITAVAAHPSPYMDSIRVGLRWDLEDGMIGVHFLRLDRLNRLLEQNKITV